MVTPAGRIAVTRNPPTAVGPVRTVPPQERARSCMPMSPLPVPGGRWWSLSGGGPFSTVIFSRCRVLSSRSCKGPPGACLVAFVRASWTMR